MNWSLTDCRRALQDGISMCLQVFNPTPVIREMGCLQLVCTALGYLAVMNDLTLKPFCKINEEISPTQSDKMFFMIQIFGLLLEYVQ